MDQNRRPSVYLEERAEELGRVLDFFLAPHRGQMPGPREMLIVFLSQLSFWEWELDNLLHAYTTFEERATAWEHENGLGIANALRTQGIWVSLDAIKDLKWKRRARAGRQRQVYAPVGTLNRVIDRWNELLRLCEERVLLSPAELQEVVRSGAVVSEDLSKFRKTPLEDSEDR